MDTEYIARKLHQCIELVENARDEDQKAAYQEYLEFWQEKGKDIKIHPITKSNEKPDAETIGGLEGPPEPEPVPVIIPIPEPSVIVDAEVAEEEADEEAEEEFLLKFPDKKAYYTRNGKTQITAAFKEFLISKE